MTTKSSRRTKQKTIADSQCIVVTKVIYVLSSKNAFILTQDIVIMTAAIYAGVHINLVYFESL